MIEIKDPKERICLRDLKVEIPTDAEIKAFVEEMSIIELPIQKKLIERDIEPLLHFMNVRSYITLKKTLDFIIAEIIKREAKDGVDSWKESGYFDR